MCLILQSSQQLSPLQLKGLRLAQLRINHKSQSPKPEKLQHSFTEPKRKTKIKFKHRSWIYQTVAVDTSSIRRKLHETSDNFLILLFFLSAPHHQTPNQKQINPRNCNRGHSETKKNQEYSNFGSRERKFSTTKRWWQRSI